MKRTTATRTQCTMLFCQTKWKTNGFSISIPSENNEGKKPREINAICSWTIIEKKRLSFFRRNFSQLYWSSLNAHSQITYSRNLKTFQSSIEFCIWLFFAIIFFSFELFRIFFYWILCERRFILPFQFEKLSWDRFLYNVKADWHFCVYQKEKKKIKPQSHC